MSFVSSSSNMFQKLIHRNIAKFQVGVQTKNPLLKVSPSIYQFNRTLTTSSNRMNSILNINNNINNKNIFSSPILVNVLKQKQQQQLKQRIGTSHLIFKRGLAGGHHPPPQYEGLELKVRTYLPENHHIVLACLGLYFGIYVLVKVRSAFKSSPAKEESLDDEIIVNAKSAATGKENEIPSMFSDNFDTWIKQPGNEKRYAESFQNWTGDGSK